MKTRLLVGIVALGLALTGCNSGDKAAVTSTSTVTSSATVTENVTATATTTAIGPDVTVLRTVTSTKPPLPAKTKVVTTTKTAPTVTQVVVKTETEQADPETVTTVVYQNESDRPSEDPRPDPTTENTFATNQATLDRGHVSKVLGINREPSSGEVQLVGGCEQGWIKGPECDIIHEEWDN